MILYSHNDYEISAAKVQQSNSTLAFEVVIRTPKAFDFKPDLYRFYHYDAYFHQFSNRK